MKKRKILKGRQIASLDHLAKCEWVVISGKPYNRGWVVSWQLRTAKGYVDAGMAYEGIRLTNGEYYERLSNEQIRERFEEDICRRCLTYYYARSRIVTCEGEFCEEAIEDWKKEYVK
jgi:hypothetical protein